MFLHCLELCFPFHFAPSCFSIFSKHERLALCIVLLLVYFFFSTHEIRAYRSPCLVFHPGTSQGLRVFFSFLLLSLLSCFLHALIGLGAAYGTAKSGVGLSAMGVLRPDLVLKCIVPVVMAGILGIYGIVVRYAQIYLLSCHSRAQLIQSILTTVSCCPVAVSEDQ